MDYCKVTEIIKKATKLDVPVYFNDMNANCSGSPYFGLGDHAWEIVDDEFLQNGMFDVEDFIENKHLGLYHVGLPDKIVRDKHDYMYEVVQKQFNERGFDMVVNETLLETFIILHELGHAEQLCIAYEGNVEKYIQETSMENRYMSYFIKSNGYAGTAEGLRLHKSISTEMYADNFAFLYIEEVLQEAKKQLVIH